jgi:hypothetical protein
MNTLAAELSAASLRSKLARIVAQPDVRGVAEAGRRQTITGVT